MKKLPIFILLLLSVMSGMSQESEEQYEDEDGYENKDEEQEEEENNSSYFDFDSYFNFNNDEYSNVLDKVNELSSEEEEELYKFIVEVQRDKVLKNRLFNELAVKPKKKAKYKGKDSPGFICVLRGLKENKTVYDAIINDGRSEAQARNAATLSERSARRQCGINKKRDEKEIKKEDNKEEDDDYEEEDEYDEDNDN